MTMSPLDPGGTEREVLRRLETILVVEDEVEVRRVVTLTLEHQGYRVISAACAAEALDLASSIDRPIDLLLTDVVMPQVSGKQLHDVLSASTPELPVLYISGYREEIVAVHGVAAHPGNFLAKPFAAAALGRKVRHLLRTTDN